MSKMIDAKGKNCPMPVIMAKKEIDAGTEELIIEVDNSIAVENLKKLAKSQGFFTNVKEENGSFSVVFNKDCEKCNEILSELDKKISVGNYSVFVGKEIIGSGSEELGKNLMKMFFYTLSESDDIPRYLLFMNDGVKVPTNNEQAIEHLKELEGRGVEILVCGACLNFYNLEEKLAVGKISNMYDITNAMKASDKVITL
ncbi:sulfurtransferase-like selenium metabolism protein YedF [Clostridium butyricum]|uniref:Selenium metabolism protein YedF n=1 Tax=Clostridium butyricum E4 str. BoNT E BL5262 TaxID=632245 RepID=C4IFT1_CLOBU|nr:sulfurtransferase-like selenium metabolism protein YedF [Clostridium butyricum]EDT75988.1 SirA family protein [Clostridium butyricum 5521]EEP54097.1 selenium metabolism protein YedF [Clostridium butyricum E4 str. BoNT E BL5262]NFL30387.1 sulfurtransferase-like selenium metabolism protein YedF [Clostridium butyricum]NFS17323.1 sulfurtransferase-like selenium metabolism protein YedF [Clostridium butyricum]